MMEENKPKPRKLIKSPVILRKIEDIDLPASMSAFSVNIKSEYSLPRIAFIGYFSRLCMSDQRYIAKSLGFECYQGIKFGNTSEESLQVLVGKWSAIFKKYTRLIVLGDKTITGWNDGIPEMEREFGWSLFRSYQKQTLPIFAENNIPIIMESELLKLHPDFPNINNSTCWEDMLSVDMITSTGPPTQGSLMDLV